MRAWPLTEERPKPLLMVGGVEIVTRIMMHYAKQGHKRFVLCLGYRPETFVEAFPIERVQSLGIEVDFCDSGPGAGTAMRISQAARMCDGECVHVTYGDGIADVDLDKVERAATKIGRVAALTAVQPRSKYGEIVLDADRVRMFVEKPVARRWINGGFMVLTREAIAKCDEYARVEASSMFVHGPMRELVALGKVGAHKHRGFWACVDTAKDLEELNDAWTRGEFGCTESS